MKLQLKQRNMLFLIPVLAVLWYVPLSQALVVSELMYHPVEEGGISTGEQRLEFIELYNDGAVFEDISGYTFSNDIDYTFPAGTIIGVKEYLVIAKDPAFVQTSYGITGVLGPYDKRFKDSGDRIDLSNEAGVVFFTFRFSDDRPWTIVPDGTGHSLVMAKLGGDPEEGSTWAPSTYIGGSPGGPDPVIDPGGGGGDPTLVTLIDIGHAGRYFKGTEEPSPGGGGAPTIDWTEITFNDNPASTDWIDGPSGYGYSNEGDETQYISTTLNDMNGGYMSVYIRLSFTLTEEQIDSFAELEAEVHYDDDYILFLNGTYVGKSSQIAAPPVAYNWGRGGGSDYSAVYHNLTGSLNRLQVGENILAIQIHNSTISGSSDAYGAAVLKAVVEDPVVSVDPSARLVINEVLANSDALPATDWIELYNPGPGTMDMSKVYLSDNRFDLLKYKISDVTPLQPGEFRVVDQGTPPAGFPFAIEYDGEKIYLTVASDDPSPVPSRVLDVTRHGALEPEMSYGRYPDGSNYLGILSSPTKNASNTSLRVHDIVINEIMYHHGLRDERYEYIELYNRSSSTVSLAGWAFTDGIEYTFPAGIQMAPDSYLVVAKDPTLLNGVYTANNLQLGVNLLGPYLKELSDHTERIQLSYQFVDPDTQLVHLAVADEVTYFDGGRWPTWADGEGSSMELIDPDSDNDAPDAWADSDESGKSTWQQIDFTIQSNDSNYSHNSMNVFALILLNRGEVLLDDIQLTRNDTESLLSNPGFESGIGNWNLGWESGYGLDLGGNHIRSFVTTEPTHVYSGSRALHLVATGHGDPGANRINQSISANGGKLRFTGRARWLRGSRFLLMRTSYTRSPTQPPRPAYVKELTMPTNLGTPGLANSMLETNRGPDIRETRHAPVLPTANEPIVVTTRVTDNDGVSSVTLYYRSEGSGSFSTASMMDNGSGDDVINGDGIFTGTIPGASAGTMRAFYIVASDGSTSTRFPTELQPSAGVPQRTCLVRVGDRPGSSVYDTYRIWFSTDVIREFTSRPNLSNELMDCTFVFNDTDVFYNAHIRWRGSPFLRGGQKWNPTTTNKGYRIEFNPDQKFGSRDEINLDHGESDSRGPLQEDVSYWFYRKMGVGLQFSTQEVVRPVFNGTMYNRPYTDVQKIDGDYIDAWFPHDNEGYIHKIDDYFEYNIQGTSHSNLDEGLKSDGSHPAIPETYRWGFEKRSHRENDEWGHLLGFASAMNTSTSNPTQYEVSIESVIEPLHFARVLAIRHACGDWDSYGYNRGKNNYFYYAPVANKWYLLPWDIDFTLGSGDSATNSIFSVNSSKFPEVNKFLGYPKYRALYLQALEELVYGPWQTSWGTTNSPTPLDIFVEEQNRALKADGYNQDGRLYNTGGSPDGIFPYVQARRAYILTLLPEPADFEITSNSGLDFCISDEAFITLQGIAPHRVTDIAATINGSSTPSSVVFFENNVFEITVDFGVAVIGSNLLELQGRDSIGNPIVADTDSITIKQIHDITIDSVTPSLLCNDGPAGLTIHGNNFEPGSPPSVTVSLPNDEIGFDALYVKSILAFDGIGEATLALNEPENGSAEAVYGSHTVLNLWNSGIPHGEFPSDESNFYPPYDTNNFNFAVRFSGYIEVPSPGTRYFGVNSDDGFSLTINGALVGSYPDIRTAATTDVTNVTIGTMSYDFLTAGRYYVVLDYFENSGGEEIEFFQTDATGGNRRLINLDSELQVYRDDAAKVDATNVVVSDSSTLTCQVDMTGQPGALWNIIIKPDCDQASRALLEGALLVNNGGDFNGDGVINIADVKELADRWGDVCSAPEWCDCVDLDSSERIGLGDLAILANRWAQGGG